MSFSTWFSFFIACWLISLSPGAGAIASMSAGLAHGFRRGYWNAIGLQLALIVQVGIVAAGIGAVLARSELAFSLIKWFGVVYLLYLGWKQWTAPLETLALNTQSAQSSAKKLMLRGFVVNASNPKAIVFILAVLPQFLDPAQPLLQQQLMMLVTMVAVDLIVMGAYTGLAARVLRLLRRPEQQRLLNRSFGSLFAAAAVLLGSVRHAGS
ncbi:LysE family transporter [Azonexus sp.]|uniref:LysE family transporter n=1 Tax=Azonexus sp. TaxID=1872668 RepID=UPI0039E5D66B